MFPISTISPIMIGVMGLVSIAIFWLYSSRGTKPKLYYVKSPFTEYIVKSCPRLSQPYHPTLWAGSRHLQTLLGSVIPRAAINFDREFVDLADGGCCAIDWVKDESFRCTANTPVLIILPGLTGDANSMTHICKQAYDRAYRPVVFNKRGHGGTRLRTPKMQSFGDPEDFRTTVVYIQEKYPDATLTAFGSSAGSGLLASYLGEYGSRCIIAFAVFESPGYDSEFLFKHCFKGPYSHLMTYMLKKLISNNRDALSSVVDMDKIMGAKDLITLEEDLYRTLYGYSTMDEYWRNNNPVRNISNGAIPVMSINSLDDPVCTKECIMHSIFTGSMNNSILVETQHGGHCGFFEGWNLENWAYKLTLDYLDVCFKHKDKISAYM